jgi:Peptidase propeptide and YPEB domain
MKFKLLSIVTIMLASSASAALAEEVCTTDVALKIKDDLTGKGYEIQDVVCRLYDTETISHRFEVDAKKDGKETELWLDEKFNVVKEHME